MADYQKFWDYHVTPRRSPEVDDLRARVEQLEADNAQMRTAIDFLLDVLVLAEVA